MIRVMKRITAIVFILCVIVIGMRIYYVNKGYSDVPEQIYALGEEVPYEKDLIYTDSMEGYSLTVLSAKVKTTEEFLEEYGEGELQIPESEYTPKVYDLAVKIKNKNNQTTGIQLWELKLQSNAAYGAYSSVYSEIANSEKGYTDIAIALRPGTEIQMHLVFILPEQTYSKRAYADVEGLNMKLVMTLYPTKKMICLQ